MALIPITRLLRRQQLLKSLVQIQGRQAVGPRCYATGERDREREERGSFSGQMWNSTAERLQRERKDEARFKRIREEQRGGSNYGLLVPFGKWTPSSRG